MDSLASLGPPHSSVPTNSLSLSLNVSLPLSLSLQRPQTPHSRSFFLSFFAVYKRFLSLASVCN